MNPGTKAKAAIKAAKTAMYAKSLAWKNCGERAWAEVTVSSWKVESSQHIQHPVLNDVQVERGDSLRGGRSRPPRTTLPPCVTLPSC